MYTKPILLTALLFLSTIGFAQSVRFHGSITNSATSFPILGVPEVITEIHPGINLALSKNFSDDNYISYFSLEGRISAYYHQFVQTVFRVQPEVTYHYSPFSFLLLKSGIGVGYAGAIEPHSSFTVSESGQFEDYSRYRNQFSANLTLGLVFNITANKEYGPQLELLYRGYVQSPFVENYVPALPINELSIGISLPLLSFY